jgi:membrane protein required for colicin V production
MNGADVLLVLVLFGSTLSGLLRGFVREAVALIFWIIALWAAWKYGPLVEPHLGGLLAEPAILPWAARLVVLVSMLVVGWMVGMVLGYFTRGIGLGSVDRVIGMLFGIVRGVVLIGLLVIGGELLHLNREAWWKQSMLIPYGETAGDWLRAMVGERGEPWATLERLTRVKIKAGKTGGH